MAQAAKLTGYSKEKVRDWANDGKAFVVIPGTSPLQLTADSVMGERQRVLDELGAVDRHQAAGAVDLKAQAEIVELKGRVRALVAAHRAILDSFSEGIDQDA